LSLDGEPALEVDLIEPIESAKMTAVSASGAGTDHKAKRWVGSAT
jgi:hypothetical protein